MEKKIVYTIKSSRKGYILYENGVKIDVFSHSFGFDTLESVVKHLEKYQWFVYKHLDI